MVGQPAFAVACSRITTAIEWFAVTGRTVGGPRTVACATPYNLAGIFSDAQRGNSRRHFYAYVIDSFARLAILGNFPSVSPFFPTTYGVVGPTASPHHKHTTRSPRCQTKSP